ncbi:MAG TPA: hypothetical protein VKA70_06645 [Blastocatellia bacterium]|nr:hypothetical protein [Blastocatellia bacterium]
MKLRLQIAVTTILLLAGMVSAARAQVSYRPSEKEMENLLERIERGADHFRSSLARSLDVSHFDDTKAEDNINLFIKEFEAATDHLKSRFDEDQSAAADVEEVLRRASRIDGFMGANAMNSRAQSDWLALRRDLDDLARAYNVSWNWTGVSSSPYRMTDQELKGLLDRVEANADAFRKSLADALDKTDFDDSDAEDLINRDIKAFENATDKLEGRFSNKRSAAADAEEVLSRAAAIDSFMRHHRLTLGAQEDWQRLRESLDQLALGYGVSWKWF